MKCHYLVALSATIISTSLFSAEPSAFGAGKLDSSTPYGLTSSEKVILQNKKNLKKVVVKSNNQANEVESLRERLDGIQSIIEGLSRKSQENRINLQNLDEKNTQELNSSNEYEKRLSELSQSNSTKLEELRVISTELSTIVDEIKSSYVSKEDFNSLVQDFNKFKKLVSKELTKSTTPKKSKYASMSNAEVAKLARKNYDKKYYTKGIEQYAYLIEKNYKPARSHYMIGEMKYYRKNYSDAIAYFKKSAALYGDASYMPTLMLHTAVAMDRTGDKKNAKSFYNAIIAKYPDSSHAKTAKSKLSKLK